ncbi:hypothetical protein VNI00_013812 [Paramarasmius palmivorus]|uniref:Uncharacterized protein n=1 Tax=Paramarasmius palmivorus TaxID=297713 RepID=A0AAW0BVZ5_9AGAR
MCLSLQKCTLDFAFLSSNFDAVNAPSQTWQSLFELKVYFRYQRNDANFLPGLKRFYDAVTTPALSHFAFYLITPPYSEIEGIPAPFLGLLQSSFSLRSLELDIPLSTKALIDCLGYVPLLKTLRLYDKRLPSVFANDTEPQPALSIIDSTLQALTPKQPFTDAILCPLLETASFRRCHLADTDALVAFTEARLGQAEGAELKSLDATFRVDRDDMKLPDEELVKAERLKMKGINVKWSSVGPSVSDAYDADSDTLMDPNRTCSPSDGMPTLIGRPY